MGDAAEPRDWKQTLNLPRTDFPMKGNLLVLEPRLLARWEKEGTWQALKEANARKPRFLFHDGPPYANGPLHAGTALNKVLKDFVVKLQNMSGHLCDFIPGWDCHGLPIERAVEKRLRDEKVDRRTLSREDFLARCRAYAQEFIDIQRTEFKRLGNFAAHVATGNPRTVRLTYLGKIADNNTHLLRNAGVAGVLIAVWAVVAVLGIGTWFPWWLVVVIPWIWIMVRRARRRRE